MPKVSEQHTEARKQQIIDAAYRCFARKGFHQATMRDIYEEAKLSPGAVYHYFNSKDEIIQASFDFDYQRSLDLFNAARESGDPLTAISDLFDFLARGLQEAAALGASRVNVQGWGEALVNPALHETIQRVLNNYLDALTHIFRRAQELGQVDASLDPASVGRMMLSLYYGLELQKALDPEVDVSGYAAAVKTLVLSDRRQDK
jgi:AcrR family transcriptional regulator